MKKTITARQSLIIILWLVALHSFCVGLGLIFLPVSMMPLFGFREYTVNFFPIQGGVFHLVMVVAYVFAALDIDRNRACIYFAIIAKSIAFIFLMTYFLLFEPVITVLLSAISDGIMGLVIFMIYRAYLKSVSTQ